MGLVSLGNVSNACKSKNSLERTRNPAGPDCRSGFILLLQFYFCSRFASYLFIYKIYLSKKERKWVDLQGTMKRLMVCGHSRGEKTVWDGPQRVLPACGPRGSSPCTPPALCISSLSVDQLPFWGSVQEADVSPGIDPRAGQGFELQDPGLGLPQLPEILFLCAEAHSGVQPWNHRLFIIMITS